MTDVQRTSDGLGFAYCDEDRQAEEAAAALIGAAWRCEVRSFGMLCPIDFYAVRDGRLVGLIEYRRRHVESSAFAEVFLPLRKWLALSLAHVGMGCPALWVVEFDDGFRFIDAADVHLCKITLDGNAKRMPEPMILVPLQWMHPLKPKEVQP